MGGNVNKVHESLFAEWYMYIRVQHWQVVFLPAHEKKINIEVLKESSYTRVQIKFQSPAHSLCEIMVFDH